MICVDVSLERTIPPNAVDEVTYWLNFASEKITKFDIKPDGGKSIKIWFDDSNSGASTDETEIVRKVQMCVDNVLDQHVLDTNEINVLNVFENNKTLVDKKDFLKQVLSSNVVESLGLADIVIKDPLVTLVRAVDYTIRDLAKKFESQEYAYSNILPVNYLESLHHFDTSPQNSMFITHMVPDSEVANQFIQETVKHNGIIPKRDGFLSGTTHALSPAVCYHVYLHLRNSVLKQDLMITTAGRNYRYEGQNAFLLERLWDFSAREIVFIGSPDFVRNTRSLLIEESQRILAEFELDGHIENCNDALFLRGDSHKFDLDPNPKYELRLKLPYKDSHFSCGSFNVHGNIFGLRNNITNPQGDYLWSGCVAFGLERWAWAIIAQHGIDTTKWSNRLQKIFERYQ